MLNGINNLDHYKIEYHFAAAVRLKNQEVIKAGYKEEIITTTEARRLHSQWLKTLDQSMCNP